MKNWIKTSLRFLLGSLIALQFLLGSATVVHAEDPVNDIQIGFREEWSYVANSDTFNDDVLAASKSWSTYILNTSNSTIENTSLTLNATADFSYINPEPTYSSPPLYTWNIGAINTSAPSWWCTISGASPPVTANFTPGYSFIREFSQIIFNSGNTSTQVMTITVTPTSPEVHELNVEVITNISEYANSQIVFGQTDPAYSVYISQDNRYFNTLLTGLTPGNPVTVTVYTEINTLVDGVEYKPFVSVGYPEEDTTSGNITGTPFFFTNPEVGTWILNSGGLYNGQWIAKVKKSVRMGGVCNISASSTEAQAMFITNWSHTVHGSDEFINQEVTSEKSWNTSLNNNYDPTGLDIEGTYLTLNATANFSNVYPEPTYSSPPLYFWNVGTVEEGSSSWGYSCFNANPTITTNFTPGLNIIRGFNQTVFNGGNSSSQVMNILVIPVSPDIDELSITVSNFDIGIANSSIISAEIYPETSVYIAPDGSNLNAHLTNLVPGCVVNMTVTLQLNPTIPVLEYKPYVSVGLPVETLSSGIVTGPQVSYTDPESGTWTWGSFNGTYDWGWTVNLNKNIALSGICQEVFPQYYNDVFVQLNTVQDYGSPGDEFIDGSVNGTRSYQTSLHNTFDTSGESVQDPSLVIQSGSSFEWVNPVPQVYGPPVYVWEFPDITQGNSSYVFARKPEDVSYSFTPGYDTSREFDKTVFLQGETDIQTMTVTIVPRKPEMTSCDINVFALLSSANSSVNATIISPAIDPPNGILGTPDGNFIGITLTGLELNVPRSVTIQLQVTAISGDALYKPFVVVNEKTTRYSGNLTSSMLTLGDFEMGFWSWNATGMYNWNWIDQKYNQVHFNPIFQPVQNDTVTVRLLSSNSTGLEGGTIQYYDGGWQSFGVTNGNGEATLDLDPGTYTFRMTYDGASIDITQDIEINPVVTFHTTNVAVQLIDSVGNPLDTGTVQYYAGGWKEFGITINGTVMKELLPKEYTFRMTYSGASIDIVQDTSVDPVVVFQTLNTIVLLMDSNGNPLDIGEVKYYAGGWNEFGSTSNGTAFKELLPKEYTFRMTYGGASIDLVQDVSFNFIVVFQTTNTAILLMDSFGNLQDTGEVKYYAGGWKEFGITCNGTVSKELLPREYTFRMSYDGASQDVVQNIDMNSVVIFQTTNVAVQLMDSVGNPLDMGTVQYYAGSWREFGITTNGTVTKELLPKEYTFRMAYGGASIDMVQDISVNPVVNFQTTNVAVQLIDSIGNPLGTGTVQYYAGGWKEFGTTINGTVYKELLPKEYTFRMNYGGASVDLIQDISVNPTVIFQTYNALVVLLDSYGNLLDNCEVEYYAGGWNDFGSTFNGTVMKELLPREYAFRMIYEGASADLTQDISVNQVVVFQTSNALVLLQDSYGYFLDTGSVQYYAGGWREFGVTNNGTVTKELLPKEYTFRMSYGGALIDLGQDISVDPVVSFQTGRVVSISGNCTSYYSGGWQPFVNGTELLPKIYTFRFNDGTPDTEIDITKGIENYIP